MFSSNSKILLKYNITLLSIILFLIIIIFSSRTEALTIKMPSANISYKNYQLSINYQQYKKNKLTDSEIGQRLLDYYKMLKEQNVYTDNEIEYILFDQRFVSLYNMRNECILGSQIDSAYFQNICGSIQSKLFEMQAKAHKVYKGKEKSSYSLWWPTPKYKYITATFEDLRSMGGGKTRKHKAIDVAANKGSKVRAARDGKVLYSGWDNARPNYGLFIMIEHSDGYIILYGHLSRLYVRKDQIIKKGNLIGLIGNTGRSTAPHLHFEIRKGIQKIDPMIFFNEMNLKFKNRLLK